MRVRGLSRSPLHSGQRSVLVVIATSLLAPGHILSFPRSMPLLLGLLTGAVERLCLEFCHQPKTVRPHELQLMPASKEEMVTGSSAPWGSSLGHQPKPNCCCL